MAAVEDDDEIPFYDSVLQLDPQVEAALAEVILTATMTVDELISARCFLVKMPSISQISTL